MQGLMCEENIFVLIANRLMKLLGGLRTDIYGI